MRADVQQILHERPELRHYIRQHPNWYRKLTRDPGQIPVLEKEANQFYGRTLPQRVEKVQNSLGLVMMMMEMLKMGQSTGTVEAQGPVE
ncbi:YlbE-like family protein [Alkalihalobacillus sp. MEB130]|uniref:YlbE-like family protein n=1 Tax=Alkalihalobacillus sp. MEB130 TaxID=2976704 RepID=UPI0028DEA0D4|nr:YlbE-like family protein [Alkalihalobacillus sp. MEB130]MDT8859152.1 YlbE-like family protein [Alkalihalobacillus sp. MEB130]